MWLYFDERSTGRSENLYRLDQLLRSLERTRYLQPLLRQRRRGPRPTVRAHVRKQAPPWSIMYDVGRAEVLQNFYTEVLGLPFYGGQP